MKTSRKILDKITAVAFADRVKKWRHDAFLLRNLEIENKGNPDSLTIHVWIILDAIDSFDARRGAFVNSM